jgi:hypothetical protein
MAKALRRQLQMLEKQAFIVSSSPQIQITETKLNIFRIQNVITETGSVDRWKAVPRFLSTCETLQQLCIGMIITSPVIASSYRRRGIRPYPLH